MAGKPSFAPIPLRALADQRLSIADFRVLGIIAAHDRMSKNGTGCYAAHATLCAKIGIHYNSLSRSVRRLGELGYLTADPHPLNRRLRVYKVIYTDDDLAIMGKKPDETVNPPVNDGTPDQPDIVNPPDNNTVNPPANDGTRIVNRQNQEAAENIEQPGVNIFCEAENRSCRSSERDSAEAASNCADAPPSDEDFADAEQQNICRKLRQLDGWLKANDETARLSAETRQRLAEHADKLEAIADCELWDSRLGNWAGRIASEIRWRLDMHEGAA